MKNQSAICSICKTNLSEGKVFTCIKCQRNCHQVKYEKINFLVMLIILGRGNKKI